MGKDEPMNDEQSLISFPCDFQIKIIGKNHAAFAMEIINIARKHFPTLEDASIRNQLSQQGNYLAISITVYATDQATLDGLYMELTKHPDIKMVL